MLRLAPCVLFSSAFGAVSAHKAHSGSLKYCFCDTKTGLNFSQLTLDNYKDVIDGFKNNMHCNGVRVPLLPTVKHPENYPAVYPKLLEYARSLGMKVYANPMEHAHEIIGDYAAWMAEFTNYYNPDFLGPFNEAGKCNPHCMVKTVHKIRRLVKDKRVQLVGFDVMHVEKAVKLFKKHHDLVEAFDIISSHNANKDRKAGVSMWKSLVAIGRRAGKPVWASENPAPWAHGPYSDLSDCIDAGVDALVTWHTFNKLVNSQGELTKEGKHIAKHVVKYITRPEFESLGAYMEAEVPTAERSFMPFFFIVGGVMGVSLVLVVSCWVWRPRSKSHDNTAYDDLLAQEE